MAMRSKNKIMQRIERLRDGKMLDNSVVRRLVDQGLKTGDWQSLEEHLDAYPFLEEIAEGNINQDYYEQMDNPYRPYPDSDEVHEHLSGPIKLGYVNETNDQFGFHPDVLCMPMIILGRPGSGKSQCQKRELVQVVRRPRDFNLIIPDRKGNEYRCLLPYSKNLKVIQRHRLRLNPFQVPEGMDPHEYLTFLAKVFVAENWLGLTSLGILLSTLEDLYRARGIFDGAKNYPTAQDVYNEVSRRSNDQKSFKHKDILLLVQNRLIPYISNKIFDCRIGIPHEIWRTENIVMEVKGLPDNVYSFIVCHTAGLVYEYNMEIGLTGSKLRTLFPIDEAKPLVKPRDTETYGDSYFSDLISLCREPGVGFQLASQEPSSFNQTTRSLSYTKICFPLTDGYDRDWVKESFALNDLQAEYLSQLGRCGKAIVSYGGYEKPFLIGIPPFRVRQLSDQDVEDRMGGFYADLEAKMKTAESEGPIGSVEKDLAGGTETVPPAAAALLFNLSKTPFTNTSKMQEFPGFNSTAQVSRALDWLAKNSYVTIERYRVTKGRPSHFAALTQKAYAYLGEKPAGKGSFEHRLFADLIAAWYRAKGMKAKVEVPLRKGSPKTSDVVVRSETGALISVQVVLHFDTLMSNLEDLELGASEEVIVTRDKKDQEKAEKLIAATPALIPYLEQISFKTIDEYFP